MDLTMNRTGTIRDDLGRLGTTWHDLRRLAFEPENDISTPMRRPEPSFVEINMSRRDLAFEINLGPKLS